VILIDYLRLFHSNLATLGFEIWGINKFGQLFKKVDPFNSLLLLAHAERADVELQMAEQCLTCVVHDLLNLSLIDHTVNE